MSTMSSTMTGVQSGLKSTMDTSTNSERTSKTINEYGFLNPMTVDDMLRLIKISSPGIDISELPVIKEAQQEHNARVNGSGTNTSTATPQTTYGFVRPESQYSPVAAIAEYETLTVASAKKEDAPEHVTVRIMVAPKDGPSPPSTSTHELFELNPNLSYIQLHDTLRRFLLKHSKGDAKSRANLSGCVFTPDHQFAKIKAIWSNVNATDVVGDNAWGGPGAALPSSDTFITEDNCAVILSAMMKRAGALDTLVLITHVPEE